MLARDVMTRRVLSLQTDATLADAARLMLANRISGVPVLDAAGGLAGMLSEGDLLRRAETGTERHRRHWLEILFSPGRLAEEYVHAHSRRVEDLMTRNVVSVLPNTPLTTVVDLMERHHIKRVPVVDAGRLVGIISRANLLQGLAAVGPALPESIPTDESIRTHLWAELDQSEWAPRALMHIQVHDGVVDLYGTVTDERERAAVRIAAQNTPGVKHVRDHMVWVDPMSGTVLDLPEEEAASRPDDRGQTKP